MYFNEENLVRCEELENKIKIICSFNNVKYNFKRGRVLKVSNTNVNFIEPHRIDIIIGEKLIILIYFNANNLFLYNRTMPITTKQLDSLIKKIKNK